MFVASRLSKILVDLNFILGIHVLVTAIEYNRDFIFRKNVKKNVCSCSKITKFQVIIINSPRAIHAITLENFLRD